VLTLQFSFSVLASATFRRSVSKALVLKRLIHRTRCLLFVRLKVPPGCTTELTHQGYQFFVDLFDKFDEVSDTGFLSHMSLKL